MHVTFPDTVVVNCMFRIQSYLDIEMHSKMHLNSVRAVVKRVN